MLSQKLQKDLMNAYAAVHEEKRGHAAGDSDVEKQASQLASDVRYKAKGKIKPGASDEEKKKVMIQILGASPAPNAVKAMAKSKLLGEEVEVKEGSMYGITKGDGMSFPERLKKKAKKKKEKMKMEEEKKPLPKNKMYRKAGNLSRKALSKGLDSKEGSKAQDRSSKIVSVISSDDERKRFSKMKTKKSELRNEEMVDEKKLVHGNYGNFVGGQKTEKREERPMTPEQRRLIPEKKAAKDYDGDGKVESGTQEFLGSRDKAIKKAIAKRRGRVKEGFSAWRIDLDFQESVKK